MQQHLPAIFCRRKMQIHFPEAMYLTVTENEEKISVTRNDEV